MPTDNLLYEGKAKKVFKTPDPQVLRIEFKDSLTAFNAQKKGSFAGKGALNRDIASFLFQNLNKQGIPSHWLSDLQANEMNVRSVQIIPLEVVVRNRLAGSTAKKLGLEEGTSIEQALVEFYYKKDELNDPFVSDDQVLMMKIAKPSEIQSLKQKALQVNQVLVPLFHKVGLELIDFKLEFGKANDGQILLADEITPDCCRLWEIGTGKKFDKDLFRRDLGGIEEAYAEVLRRLQGGAR
jgi:phosphoribosylaminoimidazole-succinocarboxamide synthase